MTAIAPQAAPNPLARLATAIPAPIALAVSVAARVLGAAFALYYAYDQDVLFPERHFPRTWFLASVIAALALLSVIPLRGSGRLAWLPAAFGALGAGMLVFGGANLANKWPGVVVLVSGGVAYVALAAAVSRERSAWATVAGLAAAAMVTFAAVGVSVVALSGSA